MDCEVLEDDLGGDLVVDNSNADLDYVFSDEKWYEDSSNANSDEDDVMLEETLGETNIKKCGSWECSD